MGSTTPTGPEPRDEVTGDFERDAAGRALLPKNSVRLDEARAVLSGYHFTKEAHSEATLNVLFYAEALLAELDRRHGGYAR